MTQARKTQISLSETPWYHCINRCVRRAYLCGEDAYTGVSYEHRRGWIRDKIKELSGIFAIDVAAYAVMSNHYHIVLRVDRDRAKAWDKQEVLKRWTKLFKGADFIREYQKTGNIAESHQPLLEEVTETYRERLYDISWYMRVLNEHIARKANEEDGVKGRFWEGRFKSQALLDETAILAAMTYVDLNPIRAGITETLEESEYTSIQERINTLQEEQHKTEKQADKPTDKPTDNNKTAVQKNKKLKPGKPLMPFDATGRSSWSVPFALKDYIELVEWTGKAVHPGKKGHIKAEAPALIKQLALDEDAFIRLAEGEIRQFATAVGSEPVFMDLIARRNVKYLRGISIARKLSAHRMAA